MSKATLYILESTMSFLRKLLTGHHDNSHGERSHSTGHRQKKHHASTHEYGNENYEVVRERHTDVSKPTGNTSFLPSSQLETNCSKCGGMIRGTDLFCPQCGEKQSLSECGSCGSTIKVGDRFCGQCGQPTLR